MERKEIIQLIPSFIIALLTAAPAVIAILQNKKKKVGLNAKNQGKHYGAVKKALCDVLKISGGAALGVFIFGLIQFHDSPPLVLSLASSGGVALVSIGYLIELGWKLPKPEGGSGRK